MVLDAKVREKFMKIAALMASDHEGERASALVMANKLLAEHKLTWRELLNGDQASAPTRSSDFANKTILVNELQQAYRTVRALRAEVASLKERLHVEQGKNARQASNNSTVTMLFEQLHQAQARIRELEDEAKSPDSPGRLKDTIADYKRQVAGLVRQLRDAERRAELAEARNVVF